VTPRRILLTTLGSLGDLHPYLALARALETRGHRAVLATSEMYRERVEAEGVHFHAVRPDFRPMLERPGRSMARYMDSARGSERVARELVMPYLAETFEDTLAAALDAELIVTHPLTLTARMAAEKLGKPWISSVLAPFSYLSAIDPPVPPGMAWMESLRGLGPRFHHVVFGLARRLSAPWFDEVHALRASLGLPPITHPMFEGAASPLGTLGLFSPVLAPPQSDWPPRVHATGFCFLDHPRADALPEGLDRFLASGDPPLVFTLGSSAVHDAREFYSHAVEHSRALGRRAVLLTGRDTGNVPGTTGPDVYVADYAPYSRVFPHAAAVVHQGGAGTTGEGLRAGRPMLVLPFSHDQFDNAARVRRIGSGDTMDRHRFGGAAGRARLGRLLDSRGIAASAEANGSRVRAEDGPGTAIAMMLASVEGGDGRC
jgi:UDP:flavonoid glycosyltransferase YjiC (YdhE family)